jgi:hypothetical protein
MASCLKGWMKRSKSRDQLRIEGFDRKVSIAASSEWGRAMSFVRCCPFYKPSRGLCPCDETHLCPICHNKVIGDPIQQKFGGSYAKAGYWYALSFCYAIDSTKARLRFITRRDSKRRPLNPQTLAFPSDPATVRRLTQLDTRELEACGQVPFKVLGRICSWKRLGIGGALGGLDLYVDFFPVGDTAVNHGLFVHVHALVNSSQPLSWEGVQRIYTLFCQQRSKAGVSLFPDLEIALLPTEKDFKNWLRYTLKPMKFEKFYVDGSVACDDRPAAFNNEFDQTVFNGANLTYGSVKTPRFYGNMLQRKKDKKAFIGVWQYPSTLNKEDFIRIRDAKGRGITAEEMEKYDEHLLYLQQQDEHRRARKARKQQQAHSKRRGGRGPGSTHDSSAGAGGDPDARAAAYARFWEREGEP